MKILNGRVIKTGQRQRGAVAIIVGICIFILVGMIGLVVDLGHMFVIKTELQNAADSCALAAARELDGSAGALERAENAGITVGQHNQVNLQSEDIAIDAADVTFSTEANGSYVSRAGGASEDSAFVKCTLDRSGIVMWFMQVMGFGDQTVAALATATVAPAQTACAIPVGICKADPTAQPPNYGWSSGDWVSGLFGNNDQLTGNFNWIDFFPPAGGNNEIKNILEGEGLCEVPTEGHEVGQTGNQQGAQAAWNSRFGLYRGGVTDQKLIDAPPDYSGYAYTLTSWPEGRNAYKGTSTSGNPNLEDAQDDFLSYQGAEFDGFKIATSGATGQLGTYGSSRRLATAPIVDCDGWATSQTVPILSWACIIMLHPIEAANSPLTLEFRDIAECATSGLPGGSAGPLVPVLIQ